MYNTFLQTIYYDGALPTGVIVAPTNNTTITSRTYTVVVRGDSTVSGVDFNIDDGNPSNDDGVTGQANGNGLSNGVPSFVSATSVSPNTTISAQYPNYPLEYRFVYTNVPTSGTATISVRLKEFSTAVYTNRYTLLTAVVTNQAPVSVVQITSPATDGTVLTYQTNTTYLVRACFSTALISATNSFNILINGVLQPQTTYVIRPAGSLGPSVCPGLKIVSYNWNNPALGTNLIQVIYTNGMVISDDRLVIVAPPLQITSLANNNQLVVWDSAPGVNYQVLATTNLFTPFLPISGPIPGSGSSTVFYDPDSSIQKFYEIQMLPP